MSSQTLTVIYTDDMQQCCICNETHKSQGSMVVLDVCKHTFDISCLISERTSRCPICDIEIDDIRLSVAISFHKGSRTELIKCLKK